MKIFSGKHLVLGGALLATSVAAYLSPDPQGDDGLALSDRSVRAAATATARAPSTPPPVTTAGRKLGLAAEVLDIRARNVSMADASPSLFAAQQWAAPVVAPVAVPQVVAQPTVQALLEAPPLPFRMLGRYEEEGNVVFFLQHNDGNLVVRLGDTIADHYKVESVQGDLLMLRHLPTNQSQGLNVGGAS